MTTLSVIGAIVVTLLLLLRTFIEGLATQDLTAWVAELTRECLGAAVRRVPRELQGDFYMRWDAELRELEDRPLTALLFAWNLRNVARHVAGPE